MLRSVLPAIFALFLCANLDAQMVKVEGRVVDIESGEPLLGASVLVLNFVPITGTVSDEEGNFSISIPEGAMLSISYTGYTPQEIAAKTIMRTGEIAMETATYSGCGPGSRGKDFFQATSDGLRSKSY